MYTVVSSFRPKFHFDLPASLWLLQSASFYLQVSQVKAAWAYLIQARAILHEAHFLAAPIHICPEFASA